MGAGPRASGVEHPLYFQLCAGSFVWRHSTAAACKSRWVSVSGTSGPALADERTINATGHGVESCKAWLEARKDGYSAGYGDWLLGYLTGVKSLGTYRRQRFATRSKCSGDDRMGRQVLYCISKGKHRIGSPPTDPRFGTPSKRIRHFIAAMKLAVMKRRADYAYRWI